MLHNVTRSLRSTSMVIALLVLAVAMTAGTVALSVVDTVVLRPLPFDRSEDLAALVASPRSTTLWQPISGAEVIGWRGILDSLDSWAAVASGSEVLQISDETTRVVSARVTASLFKVLRSRPAIGRLFTEADEAQANGSVVVISFELWQRMFGGDPKAIGTVLNLAAGPATVIGVLERNAGYPIATTPNTRTELWTLLDLPTEGPYLRLLARAKPEVSLTVASAQLQAAAQAMIQANPIRYERWTAVFVPLYDVVVGPVRSWMLLLLASVVLLLLVACVNMANVLLIQSTSRSTEMAIRATLGATRRRLALMLFQESAVLSLAPLTIAIVTAPWGIAAARAALPRGIARSGLIALDSRVLVIALGCGVVTTLIFGLVPLLHACRSDLMLLLRARDDAAPSGRKWRSLFLVAEISLVSVLTVASALFVGTFFSVTHADLGFDRSGLIEVTPARLTIPTEDAMRRLQSVPGVESVALYYGNGFLLDLLLGRGADTGGVKLTTADGLTGIMVDRRQVSSGFFSTAGVRFASGTTFGDDDASRASLVVDDVAARQLFGNQEPIGRQVRLAENDVPLTIIGVSRQVKREGPENAPRRPTVFQPIGAEKPLAAPGFLVRLSRPVNAVSASIQGVLAEGANSRRPVDVLPLETTFARFTAPRRFAASLMALIGGLALVIGAAGVYAVMSILLSQQMHEFGVRAALGATPWQLRRSILDKAARHLLVGLVLGLTVAWWFSKGFTGHFFGVDPGDWSVYLIVAAIIGLAGIVASAPVARRASRVDPIRTLRDT
jgi:putative ABC transport system permease protein